MVGNRNRTQKQTTVMEEKLLLMLIVNVVDFTMHYPTLQPELCIFFILKIRPGGRKEEESYPQRW